MITFDELLQYIAGNYDEVTIMEVLEITSEDLVERFDDKVRLNMDKFMEDYNEYRQSYAD